MIKMDENKKIETCKKCACIGWGCPAVDWDDEGYPYKYDYSTVPPKKVLVNTSFCFERMTLLQPRHKYNKIIKNEKDG